MREISERKTPLEVLIAARALIAEPEHWTQNVAARNEIGNGVGALSDSACSWCASGAVFKAAGRFNDSLYNKTVRELTPSGIITAFNDTHTHAEVLALFDAAIERLSK